MRRLLILSSLLLWVPSAWAQDVSVRFQSQLIGSRGTPLANQNVAVCTQPANTTTTPCSPLAILGTSVSTTTGGANPTTTDLNGNFFFYAPPGKYTLQFYGPAIATPFVQPDTTVPQAANNTVTLSANQAFTGNNTHSGTETFTGGVTVNTNPVTVSSAANLNGGGALNGSFSGPTTLTNMSAVSFTSLLASVTAPTIAGAGCGGTVAAIQNANGTASFEIFTGTAPTSAGCTVTFPTAAHHWICPTITHTSAVSTTNFIILQTGALSSTSVTFQLFSDVAAATAPTASDTWAVSGCHAN